MRYGEIYHRNMISNATTFTDGQCHEFDICIVGAGAAGITLALELADSGKKIVLIEAGGIKKSGKAQSLYRGEVCQPKLHLPPDTDRRRQLGGTTSLWGGRCIPFDEIDFQFRPYVPHSGWPLKRRDLDPYYRRAHVYCECGEFDYSARSSLITGHEPLIEGYFSDEVDVDSIERWSPPTHFGKKYGERLKTAENITVIVEAVVTELIPDGERRRIRQIVVQTLSKKSFSIAAPIFILSGGGLETTRLLLATNQAHKSAIGNHSDWLGKGYMCHIHGVISRVILTPDSRHTVFGYELDRKGVYCRRRFCISPDVQRKNEILNLYVLLDRPLINDPSHQNPILSLTYLIKKLTQSWSGSSDSEVNERSVGSGKYSLYWAHLKNVFAGSAQVLSVLPKFSRKRFLHGRRIPSLVVGSKSNEFSLYYQTEQVPNRDSSVLLTEEVDVLGMPKLKIDFKITEQDVESVLKAHHVIDRSLQKNGCGRLEFNSDRPDQLIRENQAVLGHHVGTTRMAASPEHGVVDENCKVYFTDGLYISSCSNFPTSSQANPTLTIVAMAIRLADHIKEGFR